MVWRKTLILPGQKIKYRTMKKLLFMISLQASLYAFSQEKPSTIHVSGKAEPFMYHIDCYLDKDTIPTSFFTDIRSFALFNTNTDASVDYILSSWILTVEAYDGKKVMFGSKTENPNTLTAEMKAAMEGKGGMLPASIVFDAIKIAKIKKTGGTTYMDGGKAVFFRGKTTKKCK
jgi:hypothetical protein